MNRGRGKSECKSMVDQAGWGRGQNLLMDLMWMHWGYSQVQSSGGGGGNGRLGSSVLPGFAANCLLAFQAGGEGLWRVGSQELSDRSHEI